jgi:hypothetical protein
MPEWTGFGKVLLVSGLTLALCGLLLIGLGKWSETGGSGLGWIGRLPGDILYKSERITFYFPLATSLLISLLLTLLFYLFSKGSS